MYEIYGLVLNKNIDVLVLGETWLIEEECKYFILPNFVSVFNCRENKVGGGTAIYVKKEFQFKIIENSKIFNKIIIEIAGNDKKLILATMYRPPSSDLNEFITNLESTLLKFQKMLFIGDFNIDVLKLENSSNYMSLIESLGFRILNTLSKNHATRSTSSSATIIDHAITSLPESKFSKTPVELIETSLSDHKALKMYYMLSNLEKSEFTFKEFQRIDYTFYNQLVTENLKRMANATIEELIAILKSSKYKATKIIRKTVRKESFRWITLNILDMMEERDRLFKLWSNKKVTYN